MALDKLIEIASPAISPADVELEWAKRRGLKQSLVDELWSLLKAKNGFFAFESALLLLPSASAGGVPGLREWNDLSGWLRAYDRIDEPPLFFAQDAFAGQFGLIGGSVIRLDPETGATTSYGTALDAWADAILKNFDYETGWSAARDWQLKHGPLRAGDRLLPKQPFILGGAYSSENLTAVNARVAMPMLASLYRQIRDAPDGTTVTVKDWVS